MCFPLCNLTPFLFWHKIPLPVHVSLDRSYCISSCFSYSQFKEMFNPKLNHFDKRHSIALKINKIITIPCTVLWSGTALLRKGDNLAGNQNNIWEITHFICIDHPPFPACLIFWYNSVAFLALWTRKKSF